MTNAADPAASDASGLHLLVYSYLLHNNCGRTAKAFARTCGLATSGRLTSPSAPEHLSQLFNVTGEEVEVSEEPAKGKRKDSGVAKEEAADETERANELIDNHIEYLHIRKSEPEVALDLLSQYFRTVLIPAPSDHLPVLNLPLRREFNATLLRFRLDTQYYVELVSNQQELDALKFGQRTLWRYPEIFDMWLANTLIFASSGYPSGPDQVVPRDELKQKKNEIIDHITNVAALVAYPDPSKSSLAFLLSQSRRKELAADVNTAILQSMRFPKEPAMVTIVRQLATTSAYLVGGRASMQSSSNANGNSDEGRKPWRLGAFVNSEADSAQLVEGSV
ncbi:hypothetical protein FBU59_000422 [Linderina macrospora]|uniref:Uncharacterized protein n=1 Tax=Linderina macrospora TaxID=4868 RepID=A0ACC1JH43_9FUNG|nr:hypothetical protein FBU59_000422 [Linderina macrospora]